MKALILAGGFATRLRPLSCSRPKILFPIVNKPLLQWTLDRLAENGVKEAVMAVNHQTEIMIRQSRITRNGIRLKYSRDPPRKPLGTGGPIKKAEKIMGADDPFLVLNGDIFADVKYAEILKTHQKKEALATIALHKVEDPSRYGVAIIGKAGRIENFVEKPSEESTCSNLINAGVYVFSPKIFEYIHKDRAVSLEREIFPELAEKGGLYGYAYDGLWMDIGKPEDYLDINRRMVNTFSYQNRSKVGKRVKLLNPSAIDKNVSIGEQSVIGSYAFLGKGTVVGGNVRIENSIVFPNAFVSDYSTLNGAIVGEDAIIGKRVKIGNGCIVGDHARIKEGVTLPEKVMVCPGTEISDNAARAT